jgi:hypothetical protein
VLVGVLFESYDSTGWATFVGVITGVVSYAFFKIPLVDLIIYGVAYLIVGFFWSFWRYKRHSRDVVERCIGADASVKKIALYNLYPTRMLDRITQWVLIWPFSMVGNFIGDFVKLIQTAITKYFRSIYHKIYNQAVSDLNIDPESL